MEAGTVRTRVWPGLVGLAVFTSPMAYVLSWLATLPHILAWGLGAADRASEARTMVIGSFALIMILLSWLVAIWYRAATKGCSHAIRLCFVGYVWGLILAVFLNLLVKVMGWSAV